MCFGDLSIWYDIQQFGTDTILSHAVVPVFKVHLKATLQGARQPQHCSTTTRLEDVRAVFHRGTWPGIWAQTATVVTTVPPWQGGRATTVTILELRNNQAVVLFDRTKLYLKCRSAGTFKRKQNKYQVTISRKVGRDDLLVASWNHILLQRHD